ncbi:AEC family transporter [Reinekea thalattae]|uniref:AEC family transporter n=1 Tax=Reinekea thalattae TaxID=2593301 RepID=A0A5C8Z6X9_9GAMM|nr:AEC family transporter [Reinekea thalattae]TXR53044.1 AEC family transporter [Reinekea thalattae]
MLYQVVDILFPIFAIVLVGFILGRWLKPDLAVTNRINMDVFCPALVFSSLVAMPLNTNQLPLLSAALVAVLLPGLLMIPLSKLFGLSFRTWAPPNMFRNSGNLAIPLFTYTFGESALAPAILLFVVSTVLHASVGLAILSRGNPIKQLLKMPVFLASVLAMTLNLAHISVWQPLMDATSLLGQAAVPIMLIALGRQMCNIQIKGIKVGLYGTLLSIFTGSVALFIIYWLIPLPTLQLQMIVLFTLLPPAVMNYMFAERFNIEPDKVASMVLISNLFTVLTLPLILTVALHLG